MLPDAAMTVMEFLLQPSTKQVTLTDDLAM
jgi:hypothetical protein